MFIRKLAFSNFAVRKSRVALTVAAVALSVSLVVAVTSGYASLFEAAFQYLNRFMGPTDAKITRVHDRWGVPEKLVDDLRRDPDVRRADGELSVMLAMDDPSKPEVAKHVSIVGVSRPDNKRVEKLVMEAGAWFSDSTSHQAILDQTWANTLHVAVGGTISIKAAGYNPPPAAAPGTAPRPPATIDSNAPNKTELILTVAGIVHKPEGLADHMPPTIYVPLKTLQQFTSHEDHLSDIKVDLANQGDHTLFEQRWTEKLHARDPALHIAMASKTRSQLAKNLYGVKLISYLGSAVSMLAATFIIFSALSMGVSERQRSLAMLRAVGAFKHQIAGLVLFEGLILAILGLIVGVPLGWIWIKSLTLIFHEFFSAGAVFSWGGLLFGACGTLLTALAASLLPAWTATRVRPLEAMSPLSQASDGRAPIRWAIIGLVLIAIDPLLFYGPMEWLGKVFHVSDVREWKFYGHFALGLPGLFVGFFLIAPMCVWITEEVAGPVVAALFGLRPALLRQQLSTGIWRAAGTGAALMVGLSVLIVMQVTGRTLLGGWHLPDKFPDFFILNMAGMTQEQANALDRDPDIAETMPIYIASPRWGSGNPLVVGAALIQNSFADAEQENTAATLFIGIDPDKTFGKDPDKAPGMMGLDFRDGNAKEAKEKLKEGRYVIVTDEYRQANPLHSHIGDEIQLGKQKFKIAGVVWSPGIDVMVDMYDLGDQFQQNTVSSVFGSIDDGKKYFDAHLFGYAADLKPGSNHVKVKARLRTQGFYPGDVRDIKEKILAGFIQLLNVLSTVAFAAMAVASLGVTNTIMASVRSRRWQFGILRSIGVTRGQLLRLVLAEAVLLGFIGCTLGLCAGFELSTDARAMAVVVLSYSPPLKITWDIVGIVAIGVGAVMLIAVGASLWPAIAVARTEPLTLLQAGRSST